MEEKERYKLESPNGTFSQIHDTELDIWYMNRQPITELLNKQGKCQDKCQDKCITDFISTFMLTPHEEQTLIQDLKKQLKQIKVLEEKNKVDGFWHSAYQGKQLEYDQVYAELRKAYEENQRLTELYDTLNKKYCKQQDELDIVRKENQQLKEKLNNFETCMKKYNVEDIELLDLMLFVLSSETKYHLKEIKDKHKKELKQSQKQLAIKELEKLKS